MITLNWKPVIAIAISAGMTAIGHSQTYALTINVPSFSMRIGDSGTGGSSVDSLLIPASTLTGSVEVVGATMREYGNWILPAFTFTRTLNETRSIPAPPPVFPNPPSPPTALTGTNAITVTSPGFTVAFDSGFKALSWTGTGSIYTALGYNINASLPITASYSLVTGGNTHTDSKAGSLAYLLQIGTATVNAATFPSTLALTQTAGTPAGSGAVRLDRYVAPNGFDTTVTVPEPSALALGLAALLPLIARRRRHA